ncbi:MAG: hypothetical protein M3217_11605, partial [Actinomycetota bacterium]|nr:hypothetical protein [Actinomycetota bacterium]
ALVVFLALVFFAGAFPAGVFFAVAFFAGVFFGVAFFTADFAAEAAFETDFLADAAAFFTVVFTAFLTAGLAAGLPEEVFLAVDFPVRVAPAEALGVPFERAASVLAGFLAGLMGAGR